jgi:hypothetical protein
MVDPPYKQALRNSSVHNPAAIDFDGLARDEIALLAG